MRRYERRFEKIVLALDADGFAPRSEAGDLVACTATLADKAGTAKRYAQETVRFSVEGPAEIVGENPQATRWGEAIVLLRMKGGAPAPVTVRCETVRKGDHVRQTGELTFTPEFSARVDILGRVACASAAPAEESVAKPAPGPAIDLSEVEQQQKDFNVKR